MTALLLSHAYDAAFHNCNLFALYSTATIFRPVGIGGISLSCIVLTVIEYRCSGIRRLETVRRYALSPIFTQLPTGIHHKVKSCTRKQHVVNMANQDQ